MAAPNLNSTSLTVNAAVDTQTPNGLSEVNLTANAAASGHTYITLSLTCTNNSAGAAQATVNYYDGTNVHRSLFQASVPPNATIETAPTRKLVLEGWTVKVTTGTANALEFTHHYLDCH
jgi:hypothetical protein